MLGSSDSTHLSIKTRIRYGQHLAARLESRRLDPRDWLWFHPDEESLMTFAGESVFDELDLRKRPERWKQWFAPETRGAMPSLHTEAIPALRERLVILVVGGLGSHLAPPTLGELEALNDSLPPWIYWIDYGNTLSADAECMDNAQEAIRERLDSPHLRGKEILFVVHSRGAIVTLDLLLSAKHRDLLKRTWGVLSVAGAMGGSPAADSLLAKVVVKAGASAPRLRNSLEKLAQTVADKTDMAFTKGLPTLFDLPEGVRDLSRKRRQAFMRTVQLPPAVRFFSIAGAIPRSRVKPNLLTFSPDKSLLYLSTLPMSGQSPLNDTQLLLQDAKWPQSANTTHLGTINADHWGLAYQKVMPGAANDNTPRQALMEAALLTIYEQGFVRR